MADTVGEWVKRRIGDDERSGRSLIYERATLLGVLKLASAFDSGACSTLLPTSELVG